MADPINNQQQQQQQQVQPVGLDANVSLRTKNGLYEKQITFSKTNCKFIVLKGFYDSKVNPKQECYLTANFTGISDVRGICIHLFDALNKDWKIDDWSKAEKTGLNVNKLRQPTEDEKALINLLKNSQYIKASKGIQEYILKKPLVVEAAFSINNPKSGTNSANKQNQINSGLGSKPKQPSAAVQGAIEGMSEKNPALESIINKVFDRIIRESIEDDISAIERGGWDAFRDDEYDDPFKAKEIHRFAQEKGMSDLDYVNNEEKYESLYLEDPFIGDLEEYGLERHAIAYYLDDTLNDVHRPLKIKWKTSLMMKDL